MYYFSIGVAVYLLCVRLLPSDAIERPQVPVYDKVKTSIFFASVLYLLYLMGFAGRGELLAALQTATFMLVLLVAAYVYFKHVRKDPQLAGERLFDNVRRAIETHAEMTSSLTCCSSTLGIMIGLFTVTGFITGWAPCWLDLGSWNRRHDHHGLDLRLAPGARACLRPPPTHRRGRDRAADDGGRHRPLGRALLRVPAVGVGRAVAAHLVTAAVSARIANARS